MAETPKATLENLIKRVAKEPEKIKREIEKKAVMLEAAEKAKLRRPKT